MIRLNFYQRYAACTLIFFEKKRKFAKQMQIAVETVIKHNPIVSTRQQQLASEGRFRLKHYVA